MNQRAALDARARQTASEAAGGREVERPKSASAASSTNSFRDFSDAVRTSEAQLHAVLETAVDAIVTIDGRGIIQSVNPATLRMFGYAAEELIGQNVRMLMPSPYRDAHDDYMAEYLRTGVKRIIGVGREVQAIRKDGVIFPIDLAVSEVEPGKLFTGMIRDISERKTSEVRLRAADRMASIGALAAGLGHDINNVLLPVRAHLNALRTAPESTAKTRKHLDKIHHGVAYLQQLADGLHFLAMDPDKVDDVSGVTDLQSWWAQTGPLLMKAVPKHVKVTAKFRKNLPPVSVAAHALTQAVLNLIVNAGEAIPPDRVRRQGYVRLSTRLADDESHVILTVADNGTGMTEEVKRRAFDMFFTTKPRGLGTGLGLAMVRKVVDRAGGMIEVDSEPGKGTAISLCLPIAVHDDQRETIAAIWIHNGRVASLIRNLLEASGVNTIGLNDDLNRADILVAEASSDNEPQVRAWRAGNPSRQVVLLGPAPGDQTLADLNAIVISDPDDLHAVQLALNLALQAFDSS